MSGELQNVLPQHHSISTASPLPGWGRWRFGLKSFSRPWSLVPAGSRLAIGRVGAGHGMSAGEHG